MKEKIAFLIHQHAKERASLSSNWEKSISVGRLSLPSLFGALWGPWNNGRLRGLQIKKETRVAGIEQVLGDKVKSKRDHKLENQWKKGHFRSKSHKASQLAWSAGHDQLCQASTFCCPGSNEHKRPISSHFKSLTQVRSCLRASGFSALIAGALTGCSVPSPAFSRGLASPASWAKWEGILDKRSVCWGHFTGSAALVYPS